MRAIVGEIVTYPSTGAVLTPLYQATVAINVRAGAAATLYTTETGSTQCTGPIKTDRGGHIEDANGIRPWVDEGDYDLVISKSGITTYTQPFSAISGASALGGKELVAVSTYFSGAQFGDATGSYVDVTGLDTGVFTVGTRPIVVEFSCLYAYATVSTGAGQIQLWDVTNSKNRGEVLTMVGGATNALMAFCIPTRWRLPSLTPGSYQFRMRWKRRVGTGTVYLTSDASGTTVNEGTPAVMRVIEG